MIAETVSVWVPGQTAGRLSSAEFQLRDLGSATVRGRREPVQAFTLA